MCILLNCPFEEFFVSNILYHIFVFFPFFTAERSCTGLIEFETKADGIEGLVLVNHTPISMPGMFIFPNV